MKVNICIVDKVSSEVLKSAIDRELDRMERIDVITDIKISEFHAEYFVFIFWEEIEWDL